MIETDRLRLRPPAAEDVEFYCSMMADPEIAKFLTPDGKPQARPDAWRGFASWVGHWTIRGYGFFSIEDRATGELVGRAGPWRPEGWPGLECGWAIARPCWGKGYAPEAAIAAVNWTFDQFPDLSRIISVIEPGNVNSQAVARKIGEEKSGETFEFWGWTLDIWAADRDAWLARFG